MLEVLFFAAGIQMMIELLAAGYRFIDLKYRLGDFWVRLTLRALILLALDTLLLTQLPDIFASAFFWGQATYLVFHIGIFWLIRDGLSLLRYKPK